MFKYVILFDGECGYCSGWIQTIIGWDKKNKFGFSAIKSDHAKEYVQKYKISTSISESVILIDTISDKYYEASEAVLRTFYILGFPWRLCYIFIIVPKFIRDTIYFIIAKNRHWMRKSKSCSFSERERTHFL